MTCVQALKYLFQIKIGALGAGDELAPADLPDQLQLLADLAAVQVQPVTPSVDARDRTPVELAQQHIRQRLDNGGGRAFEDVGDPYRQAAGMETYGAVGIGVAAELDANLRKSGSRLEIAENPRIDFGWSLEK